MLQLEAMSRWSVLRRIGRSAAARGTVLIPIIGYFILFNATLSKYFALVGAVFGTETAFGVPPKLLIVYLGLCCIAVGTMIFALCCPPTVKKYDDSHDFVAGDGPTLKEVALQNIEKLVETKYSEEIGRIRLGYQAPRTPEQKQEVANAVLHIFFEFQNTRNCVARWACFASYLLGFALLAAPSLGVFLRVIRVVYDVATTQMSLIF